MRLACQVEFLCANETVIGKTLLGLTLLITRGRSMFNDPLQPQKRRWKDLHHSTMRDPMNEAARQVFTTVYKHEIADTPLYIAQRVVHSLGLGYSGANRFPLMKRSDSDVLQHKHLVAIITDNHQSDFLGHLLAYTAKMKCSEPRDMIFSVLPIVKMKYLGMPIEEAIQSDYKTDVYDLAVELAMLMTHESDEYDMDFLDVLKNILRGLEVHKSSKFMETVEQRRETNYEQNIAPLTKPLPSNLVMRGWHLIAGKDGALTMDIPQHQEGLCGYSFETVNTRSCRGCCFSQSPSFASGRTSTRRKLRERRASRTRSAPYLVDITNYVVN
ncbi:hypothetical protein GGR57DRAFT_94533 [Xylariaceae sp. FL1272]|nr:hypothetical protein GGR57DRAFT_94533 [Xylariaceae sp. FL1272]